MNGEEIRVGDVALDVTQGSPVHVLEDTGQTAAEWSDANDYELCENYGNSRCGAEPEDRVYDVVYCSSGRSEPSKTYAMPESRLLRIETEAADDGRPVADRVAVGVLEQLFDAAYRSGSDRTLSILEALVQDAVGKDLTTEARELADVGHTIAADGEVDDAN
ncbi:hypothetical protein [Halobellus rufus]|uniref:hypothetical protein n=1 Tax=Halobellus rufus TaxID=1448860 RepID=UPI00067902DA|nr:hypothetical protein [Halobellus rufus]